MPIVLDGTANTVTPLNGALGATTPSTVVATSVNTPDTFGFKNRIINGDMRIDQRNAGASKTITDTGAVTYTLDRWLAYGSAASKFSIQRNAGSITPPEGFSNYLGVTSLAATTVGSTDFYFISQYIEGFNSADLAFGTAGASAVTLSFRVYSSLTGTFGGALSNSASDRSYPFSYSIPTANTWTTINVTIAGDTTGTWVGATNGSGLKLWISLGIGSTYSGTAGSWLSGSDYRSATGSTSVVGTNGATFYITGVQLEKGSTATSFDVRDYGRELIMCQRYYEKSNEVTEQFQLFKARESDRLRLGTIQYKVTKLTTPTIVLFGANGDGGGTPAAYSIGTYAFKLACIATSDGQSPWVNGYSASSEL